VRTWWAFALAAMLLSGGAAAPAGADETGGRVPTADAAIEGGTLPSSARPGERITVWSSGWPAGSQVQGVVCGDLAIGGSGACDLPRAVLARTDGDGSVALDLVLGAPPRPCPCVVRLSTFDGPALSFNIPVDVVGHRTGTPPAPAPVADLRLGKIRLEAADGLGPLFGLGGGARLVVSVVNRGAAPARVPDLSYGLGDADVVPAQTVSPEVRIPPGGRREVVIDVSTPPFAFGTHHAVVRWADQTGPAARATLTTRPWGALVVLLLLAVALVLLLAAAATRRTRQRRRRRAEAPPAHLPEPYPLPDVVYLEEVGGYLVNPRLVRRSRIAGRVSARVTAEQLVDLTHGARVAPPAVDDPARPLTLLDDDRELDEISRT